MRCAKCGKELPLLPHALEGRVKMRCRACFGAAPETSPTADVYDRAFEHRLATRMRDEWSEAA